MLGEMRIDFDAARQKARLYDPEAWKTEIRRAYGNAADAIIQLEETADKNGCAGRLERIDRIQARWTEIKALLDKAYPWEKLRDMLKDLGCPCDPKDIGITPAVLKDTLLYCKETRDRYTVYQLAWDLGVMEELADRVIHRLKQENML